MKLTQESLEELIADGRVERMINCGHVMPWLKSEDGIWKCHKCYIEEIKKAP